LIAEASLTVTGLPGDVPSYQRRLDYNWGLMVLVETTMKHEVVQGACVDESKSAIETKQSTDSP